MLGAAVPFRVRVSEGKFPTILGAAVPFRVRVSEGSN
jgi:hypothetical protein